MHVLRQETYLPGFRFVEDPGTEIAWGSAKLKDIGFQYKFDAEMILDESEKCAKKLDAFGAPK